MYHSATSLYWTTVSSQQPKTSYQLYQPTKPALPTKNQLYQKPALPTNQTSFKQPTSQTAWLKVTPHCNHCTIGQPCEWLGAKLYVVSICAPDGFLEAFFKDIPSQVGILVCVCDMM
jgi:hypothetical protein